MYVNKIYLYIMQIVYILLERTVRPLEILRTEWQKLRNS